MMKIFLFVLTCFLSSNSFAQEIIVNADGISTESLNDIKFKLENHSTEDTLYFPMKLSYKSKKETRVVKNLVSVPAGKSMWVAFPFQSKKFSLDKIYLGFDFRNDALMGQWGSSFNIVIGDPKDFNPSESAAPFSVVKNLQYNIHSAVMHGSNAQLSCELDKDGFVPDINIDIIPNFNNIINLNFSKVTCSHTWN